MVAERQSMANGLFVVGMFSLQRALVAVATANPFIEIKCANFDDRDENWPQWVVNFDSYMELTGVGAEMENAAT